MNDTINRERIHFTTKEAWLQERVKDLTSTDIAALFGLSPYMTEFELYHRKQEGEIVTLEENERMFWGNKLESVIAESVAEKNNWTVEPHKHYTRISELRLGSSFDYLITSLDEPTLLEIKVVDSLVFKNTWLKNDDGQYEAPEHIEIQVQHQMEVENINSAYIAALVGGNTLILIKRERDTEIGAAIRNKAKKFWQRIADNNPPAPDFSSDAEFLIKHIYNQSNDGEVLDAKHDSGINQMAECYAKLKEKAAIATKEAEQYKAMLLSKFGNANKVITDQGTFSCGVTKANQGTLITADMVGTYINPRSSYRQFRFTAKK